MCKILFCIVVVFVHLNDPYLPEFSLATWPLGFLNEKLWVLFLLKLRTLLSSCSSGSFFFEPNCGHQVIGTKVKTKRQSHVPNPQTIAMTQCSHGRPSGQTLNVSPENWTIKAYPKAIKAQIMRKVLFSLIPLKMFFSSLTFLALTKLKICITTKTLKTLDICLLGPYLSSYFK